MVVLVWCRLTPIVWEKKTKGRKTGVCLFVFRFNLSSFVGVQSSTLRVEMPVSDVGVQSSTPPTVMPGADVHVTVMPVLDVRVQSDMLLKETLVQGDDNPMPTKLFYGRKRAADGKGFDAAEHQSKCQLPMKRQRRRPIRFQ